MIVDSYSNIYQEDSTLRPYQQKAKQEIFESWEEVDSVMFQMPTGTGKTRLFTSIISDINKYSIQRREAVKILIIAHRTELIEQISESLMRYRVAHHVVAGGREKKYYAPVIVASIQTITNRHNIEVAKKLKVQFVIIDEAHHSLAASYKKLWEMYPDAKRLGVTATPWRMNHQSFTSLFDKLVLSMPIKDFIKKGFLAPYKYFSLRGDTDIQRTIDDIELDSFGEYKESSMEEKMDIGSIRAQLLDSYQSLAKGKKGIIYAINISHARHICWEYEQAGYRTVCIDSKTPAAERKRLVTQFKKGLIDIIVNVDIFSEGFDCPDIEFIQLARPTRSLVKYLQQVGRGLRPTENKQHCVILDNVGMYSRFGLPDARRHWKYHFIGKDVDEEPKRLSLGGGFGGQRFVDLSEGTEDMELIQDVNYEADNNENTQVEDIPNNSEYFDVKGLLEEYNFVIDNFIFYFKKTKRIYEAYIHEDKYYIISELVIDNVKHCVHRHRVGKVPSNSWIFWQMLSGKIDELHSIKHYGANYTLFHYKVLSSEKKTIDRYFDYKGKEIDNPNVVKDIFDEAIPESKTNDYIDLPVSKASFKIALDDDKFTIYRTINVQTRTIAIVPIDSEFGNNYYSDLELINMDREKNGLSDIKPNNTRWLPVIRSDENSFTVKKYVNSKGFLIQYNLNGKSTRTISIVEDAHISLNQLSKDDTDRLWKAFKTKVTSYNYFWFLSILQIYRETQKEYISFREILVRWVANAWKYVFYHNGKFPISDQLPMYLRGVQLIIKLKSNASISVVENKILTHPKFPSIYTILKPLLKNVPYRFLSPWINTTSNNDVVMKSNDPKTRCPYELHDSYIVINDLWKEFLIDSYDDLITITEYKLISNLKVFNILRAYDGIYNKKYKSLSRLLKDIQSEEGMKLVRHFMIEYNLPTTGKITPREIIDRIPDSRCTIDIDGKKVVNIREGEWSLKRLEELLS